MKVYTKTGDQGKTSLFGGERVFKCNLRLEAYGTVDELNSFIGLLVAEEIKQTHIVFLQYLQNELFTAGAILATPPGKNKKSLKKITEEHIKAIENQIDKLEEDLPALKNFIIPGGSRPSSLSHVCRSVCRRAERLITSLHQESPVEEEVLQFFNRLSDYFFVLSRHLIYDEGKEEVYLKY